MNGIIDVVDLHHRYRDGTEALRGVDISIQPGERVAIMGANGSGKSTLFLHLNGILKPSGGSINYRGKPVEYSKEGLLDLRRKVGIVFQNPDNQLFSASVFEEISFGPLNLGLSDDETRRRVDSVIDLLGIEEFQDKPVHLLSGGQKKIVAIADILVMEPEVIVLDEPTSDLDGRMSGQVNDIIEMLVRQGKTVIMSTHDVDRALSWADRVIVMGRGQVVGNGIPEMILGDSQLLESCNIDRPVVLRIFEALARNEDIEEKPKTVDKLIELIKERMAGSWQRK